MAPSIPSLSVIVPVFNQWDLIPGLLDCLKSQSLPADDFEVLLVDNGSTGIPPPEPKFMQYLLCSMPGSYSARNHGASRARGKLLVFTDADCRPNPDWLREIFAASKAAGADKRIIAGAVTIAPKDKDNLKIAELYDTVMGIPQEQYVRRGYGVTANLAVSKELFDRLGGFETPRFSGGDAELCRRATAREGVIVHYCSKAIVIHPARDSIESLIIKVRRIRGGQVMVGPWPRRVMFTVRAFMPPVRALFKASRASSFTWGQRLIVCLVQLRLWLAGMAEVLRLIFGKEPERR